MAFPSNWAVAPGLSPRNLLALLALLLSLSKISWLMIRSNPPRLKPDYHEPGRNDSCVCGSGLKFKKCCLGSYSSDAAKEFRSAYNRGDYSLALIAARRHFTWYALCHRAHTIPLLEKDAVHGQELLRIDIEALAELLDNLRQCYFHLGIGEEFPGVIDNAREFVDDSRWVGKIAYTEGLYYLVEKEDEAAAFSALAGIDIESCADWGVLSLYLQVCPGDLSLPAELDIIDRILKYTESEAVRLQYRVLKALKYYLVCEQDEGDRILEDALAQFTSVPTEDRSTCGRVHFAQALEIYGKEGHRIDAIKKAKVEVKALIFEAQEGNYVEAFLAELMRLLGDCENGLGNSVEAVNAYMQSLETFSDELTRVFLVRALCNSGQTESARRYLNEIVEDALDDPGRFDLAISWALLAATSLRAEDIGIAVVKLKAVQTKYPAFVQMRDQWIIDLLEATPSTEVGKIRKLIRRLNSLITLNPSVFGVGLNINKIIDEIDSAVDRRKG